MNGADVPTVDIEQTAAHDGAFLLDVREVGEWIHGHIPGTVNIPLGELADRLDDVARDREVIVICRSGNRSALATQLLRSIGIEAFNMRGGTTAWGQAGKTLLNSGGEAGVVV